MNTFLVKIVPPTVFIFMNCDLKEGCSLSVSPHHPHFSLRNFQHDFITPVSSTLFANWVRVRQVGVLLRQGHSQRKGFCLQVGLCHVSNISFTASKSPSLDWLMDHARCLGGPYRGRCELLPVSYHVSYQLLLSMLKSHCPLQEKEVVEDLPKELEEDATAARTRTSQEEVGLER